MKHFVNNKFVNLLEKCYDGLTIVFLNRISNFAGLFADGIWIRFFISFFKPKKKFKQLCEL